MYNYLSDSLRTSARIQIASANHHITSAILFAYLIISRAGILVTRELINIAIVYPAIAIIYGATISLAGRWRRASFDKGQRRKRNPLSLMNRNNVFLHCVLMFG